ncbi:primosomal protein N' [candidate division KSB3 bacterium]|uniref:Replication restart protein PriA n=1 Tax=candidate division KSB3 bacterium TaxID=2044937 RepID=A0A2G6E8I4_9BACT|nr:MAG: primosomal protein N' [candidate division KSB3 bacterium]PIE30452.1 MAG: primosomal protein N' [candidate division KSB3 bacterium]
MKQYVDVAVPLPVSQSYSYRVPVELQEDVELGKRVLVPFGRKVLTGCIVGFPEFPAVERLKEILDLLDSEPVVSETLRRLTKWISEYYACSWGVAIKAALPSGMDSVHTLNIHLCESALQSGSVDLFGESVRLPSVSGKLQKKILELLQQDCTLTLQELQKKLGRKNLRSSLYLLEKQGYVEIEEQLKSGTARTKRLQHIVLSMPAAELADIDLLGTRAPKQARIFRFLKDVFPDDLPVVELQEALRFDPRSSINALAQKGYVKVYVKDVRRQPAAHFTCQKSSHLPLSQQQEDALKHILNAIDSEEFRALLLHGVTGSGKTEIYMQAIAHVLSLKRRAIVLVPEISLTPLLTGRFFSRFEDNVAVLHSGLSTGERYDEWQRIRRGDVDVVIGARSAIFAPMSDVGLIVVDEEHEMSYKQDSEPRYHGRDTAVMRARIENIPIILGSATPSLESYYNAQTRKYQLLTIDERIDERPLPKVEILDRRQGDSKHLFSNALEEAIRKVLSRGEQVLLFLNLRGFANFYLCKACGFVYECPRCNVSLTYHVVSHRLQCHYCDFSRTPPGRCEQCSSPDLRYRGIGTERIEQDIQLLFPDAEVARMDRDTVSGKNAHFKILQRFEQGDIDILIGTQMISKGHDFHNVTLVGVISAETGLHLPDFRAGERTFQLLTQVAGRTGRGRLRGEVMIQTYAPEHYAILAAQHHDYFAFYNREIVFRRQLNYPPFSRLINILLQSRDDEFTHETAVTLARQMRQHEQACQHRIAILGPSPAALTRLRSKFRYQILLKSAHSLSMRRFVKEQLERFCGFTSLKDLQILVDVDPVNLL